MTYQLIAVLSPSTTSYVDSSVVTGTNYQYYVATINDSGQSDTSVSSSVTPPVLLPFDHRNDAFRSYALAMKLNRLISSFLVAMAGGCLCLSSANAQDASLLCVNKSTASLINLPLFPQILNVNVYVLTDAYTPINSHGVTVVRTQNGNSNNVALLNFDTLAQGVVIPNYGSTTYTYGQ